MKNFSAQSLDDMSVEQIAKLDAADLALIDAELEAEADVTKRRTAKVADAKARKWGDVAAQARKASGKDTGTVRVRLTGGDCVVVCDLPKRVKWDQVALRAALDRLEPEDKRHYAKVTLSVDERKFDAAPPAIRDILAPARTVETGKPSYTIETKKENA